MIKNEPSEIRRRQEKYYGIYRGVVEDDNDSSEWPRWKGGTGRVRVRVWGIHTKKKTKTEDEGIPTNELIWADPAYPVIEGSITSVGLWSVPVKGTHVFLFFESGDHMQARYFACVPGIEPTNKTQFNASEGFCDPDGKYPITGRLDEPDFSRVARGEIEDTYIEEINDNVQSGSAGYCSPVSVSEDDIDIGNYPNITSLEFRIQDEDYPWKKHALMFDSTIGYERSLLFHPSKSYITIDNNGQITVHSKASTVTIIESERKILIKGSSNSAIQGDKNEGVSGSWTVDVAGTAIVTATAIILGDCSGPYKYLSTSDHVHPCGDCSESEGVYTGAATQNTMIVKAN